jgi:leader peptidase (prepilin peptidase) / N-methyltransferase
LPNDPSIAGERPRFADGALRRAQRTFFHAPQIGFAAPAWGAAALCAAAASIVLAPGFTGMLGAALAIVMIGIAVIDARHFLIPDKLVLVGLSLGLLNAAIASPHLIAAAVARAALRAFVLVLFLFVFRVAYRRVRRRDGLGLGDVKLAGVAGAWLGWAAAGLAIDIAALSALAAVLISALRGQRLNSKTRIPFGLFFAPAIWIVWLLEGFSLRFLS